MRAARFLSAVLLGGLALSGAGRSEGAGWEGAPPRLAPAARPGVPERSGAQVKSAGKLAGKLAPRASTRAPARSLSRSARLAHLNLFMLPTQGITLPLVSPWMLRDPPARTPPSRRRPIFTMEGILIGDYYLVPNLVFGTDNRYDDANTRERVLRDELNFQDARRRGELREDPLTQLLRKRVRRLGGDPGFKVALVIRHLLQGTLQPPNKSVELIVRPDGRAPGAPAAPPAAVAAAPASPLPIVSPKRYEGGNQVGSTGTSGFPGSAAK